MDMWQWYCFDNLRLQVDHFFFYYLVVHRFILYFQLESIIKTTAGNFFHYYVSIISAALVSPKYQKHENVRTKCIYVVAVTFHHEIPSCVRWNYDNSYNNLFSRPGCVDYVKTRSYYFTIVTTYSRHMKKLWCVEGI